MTLFHATNDMSTTSPIQNGLIPFAKGLFLSVLSGLLLSFAWPPSYLGPMCYVAFVPLFFHFESLRHLSARKRYLLTATGLFTTLLVFIFLETYNAWGVYNTPLILGTILNYLPLVLIASLFTLFRHRTLGWLFLIFSWASMEILILNWSFNTPLLILGNGLSMYPSLIQHYAIWGVIGGSMYILAMNVLFFRLLFQLLKKEAIKRIIVALSALVIPLLLSIVVFVGAENNGKTIKIATALLHYEHFNAQNVRNPFRTVKAYNELLSDGTLNDADLVVLPESAVINSGWIESLNSDSIHPLDALCPGKELILGSHMFSIYQEQQEEIPYFVRMDKGSGFYYQSHNCAIFRSQSGYYNVRSKDKNVPFYETIPYPSVFSFTQGWFGKSDGSTYLSTYEQSQSEFKTKSGVNICPLICYEAFFSDMVLGGRDADFILVLANESWNYQTRGKEQYFHYMVPKAIESGKSIVKIANSGISGVISPNGTILRMLDFKHPQSALLEVTLTEESTLYSQISDFLTVLIPFVTLLLFIALLTQKRDKIMR